MPRVYFDTCCLNRPFDDQTQERIRLESEAIVLIMGRLQSEDDWTWIGSHVLRYETKRIPDLERRRRIQALLEFTDQEQAVDPILMQRAIELRSLGFKAVDALHIACAEASNCEILLTTDDRMVQTARRNAARVRTRIENPLDWLQEVEEE